MSVYLFTGDGKGKTTAAIGLAVRALGHSKKVAIIQFMKESAPLSGEIRFLKEQPGVSVFSFGRSFIGKKKPDENQVKQKIKEGLDLAKTLIGQNDVLILDEINFAESAGLADLNEIVEIIEMKDDKTGLVLTGRNASEELVKRSDVVTEMKKIKHHFDKGIRAVKGFEF